MALIVAFFHFDPLNVFAEPLHDESVTATPLGMYAAERVWSSNLTHHLAANSCFKNLV
jgi:hypothetical protein